MGPATGDRGFGDNRIQGYRAFRSKERGDNNARQQSFFATLQYLPTWLFH